mgnify:CR=1 FL=1
MKIFHFILGKANKERANGVNQVISGLCKYSSLNGASIKVIGFASNSNYEGEVIDRDNFAVKVFSLYRPMFLKNLLEYMKWSDVIHLHGLYNFQNIAVAMLAKRLGKPYVLTLHNGLSPTMSSIKKKLFDYFIQKKHIERAAAIHILALEESSEILSRFSPKKFIYAPNGIDLDDIKHINVRKNFDISQKNEIKIGFLGRVSKEKNIYNLVEALDQVQFDKKNIKFVIASPDSKYLKTILNKDTKLNIDWIGPKYGDDKYNFIRSLDLFIHPSKADVFSIAAMEVLSIGTPLVITRSSKVAHFFNTNSFFMSEPTIFGLRHAIEEALIKNNIWESHSANGRRLINTTFNWNSASLSLIKGYTEILDE